MIQHHRVEILANKLHRLPHHSFRRQDQVLVQHHDAVSLAPVRSIFSLIRRSTSSQLEIAIKDEPFPIRFVGIEKA